jgi:uncharacterized RDD family membrane protein YckC
MSPITILSQANVPMGPFTREQVTEKLRKGEVTMSNLAFIEGLSQWTPLRDVLARVDAITPPLRPVPVGVAAPPTGTPGYSYAATMQPPSHLVYAGFWLRFVAYLIDSLIVLGVTLIVAFAIAMVFIMLGGALGMVLKPTDSANSSEVNPVALLLVVFIEALIGGVEIVLFWLYFAKLESGPKQATLGKRLLGLRVTDFAGERISFGRATGRTFAKFVSALPLEIGFMMAGWTERKQALHDMIAGTLVVRN